MMRIGIVITTPGSDLGGFEPLFQWVKQLGFEGIGFRSLLQLSDTLDPCELGAAHQCAAELGLFLNFGLGWVNPFNALTKSEIWALGQGDYFKSVRRQLEAACLMGCTEMVGEIAGVKGPYEGRFAFDRFRTDVSWEEQLGASERFLRKIAPLLDETGIRINLENHEDLTSYELLRMINSIGPTRVGITLDTANLPVLGEDPVEGARRLAPYTHLAHVKDIFLLPAEKGLLRQIRPAGEGVIDWQAVLQAICAYDSNVHLLVEDHKGLIQIDLLDPWWRAQFPENVPAEIKQLQALAAKSRARVERGEIEAPEPYEMTPYADQKLRRLTSALGFLKELRETFGTM